MTVQNETGEEMMTMPEAQEYLVSYGVPVRSRFTFYRYLDEYQIPFINLTPWSRYANRRFRKADLDKFLEERYADITQNLPKS